MALDIEEIVFIGIIILLLIIILILLESSLLKNKSKDKDASTRGYVSKEKHSEVLRERDALRLKLERIELEKGNIQDGYDIQEKYEKACVEIGKLKCIIDELKCKNDELTRENNELNELYNKDSTSKGEDLIDERSLGHEMTQKTKDGQITKYASFPRSAGSSIYFSDLTDKLVDDSYFELKIISESGKASFRPLDFMKIRNYDPAMAAILTDGVKPNVASTIVGVEPGDAYLEGNDWIINKLAKVKLA